MNRLRLTDVREPVGRIMNMDPASTTVRRYINEAHARLVPKGKWVGTMQLYRVCVNDSCLVWPRQIETIEAWALCQDVGIVRNKWYEFISSGPGILKESQNWFRTLVDRGTVPAFDEIDNGTNYKITVQAGVTESGKRILLQGYDENAQWIRTLDAGSWVDGEYVTVSTTATQTSNFFTSLTGVIKPVTNGPVRLFQYNNTTGVVGKALAYYENDETVPIYRRSFVPGMANITGCDGDSDCDSKSVTVMAKLRHIEVTNDNDFLLLGSASAIKLMVQAILKEERNLMNEALVYEQKAIKELQDELQSFEGDGAVPVMRTEDREIWGPGVLNVLGPNYWGW